MTRVRRSDNIVGPNRQIEPTKRPKQPKTIALGRICKPYEGACDSAGAGVDQSRRTDPPSPTLLSHTVGVKKKERIDSNVNVDPCQRKAKLQKMSAAQHDLRRVRVLLGSGRHERVDTTPLSTSIWQR